MGGIDFHFTFHQLVTDLEREMTTLLCTECGKSFTEEANLYIHQRGIFHFTFWASPQHFLLHFPINLFHFPIKFASFPQKNAAFPQQNAAFPQQIASFTQRFAEFPHAILCHFANLLKPDFTNYFQF